MPPRRLWLPLALLSLSCDLTDPAATGPVTSDAAAEIGAGPQREREAYALLEWASEGCGQTEVPAGLFFHGPAEWCNAESNELCVLSIHCTDHGQCDPQSSLPARCAAQTSLRCTYPRGEGRCERNEDCDAIVPGAHCEGVEKRCQAGAPCREHGRYCTLDSYNTTSCETDGDCTRLRGGKCERMIVATDCRAADSCSADADCYAGQICLCEHGHRSCVDANCKQDADCGLGSRCERATLCGGALQGLYCTTPHDACDPQSRCGPEAACSYDRALARYTCTSCPIQVP